MQTYKSNFLPGILHPCTDGYPVLVWCHSPMSASITAGISGPVTGASPACIKLVPEVILPGIWKDADKHRFLEF